MLQIWKSDEENANDKIKPNIIISQLLENNDSFITEQV